MSEAIDLAAFVPDDNATLEILKPGGIEGTGWRIEFAGPAHAKTLAWNNAETRKNLRRQAQIEQAQVNGRKYKSEEREPEDIRRDNVAWVVARIISWTPNPLRFAGEEIVFNQAAAVDLLMRPTMAWALTQMVEFLADERSFTRGLAPSSEPTPNTSSL